MSDDAPVDVGDEKQVDKKKKKYELVRERELEEIRQLLYVSWGRGFLSRMLSEAKVFHSISHHDTHSMATLSGRRDLGLWVISEVEAAAPNGYCKLMHENERRDNYG